MKHRVKNVMWIIALTNQAFAAPILSITALKDYRWISSMSLSSSWENGGETQTFYLAPNIEKTYTASHSTNSLIGGEIFVGIQKDLPNALQGQLGLALAATNNANLSGNIWDDANANFNNYRYHYKIQHSHVAIKGKLLVDRGYWFMPWMSASVGIGFNDARDFQNIPLISEAVSMPNFASNTETSFTYTVGVGIQKLVNQHWQVGCGYEFADWGESQLHRATNQTLNEGLSLNHLYTHSIVFNLTYLT